MRRKIRKTTGLLGLGIIGSRVAASLRAAGYQVYVWNRTPKPAPNFLPSPAEVAEVCEIVQLFVADGPALLSLLEAMGPKLTPEHLVICSATVGPEATLDAAKFVEERGARFLDAPFTGSKVAAERGQLVYYVGGDDAAFLRARPVLEASSKAIVRVGAVGDAAILKVVTNQIAAVSIQALAEAVATVRKAGLPVEALAAALEHNACRSGTMDLKLPKMLSGDYEPHFALKHMFKDVQLGVHLATVLDLKTPTSAVTAGVMFGAMKRGWGDLDFSAIFKVYDGAEPSLELEAPAGEAVAEASAETVTEPRPVEGETSPQAETSAASSGPPPEEKAADQALVDAAAPPAESAEPPPAEPAST